MRLDTCGILSTIFTRRKASSESSITKTCLFKYIENVPPQNEKFQIKNADMFHISAQNIDCVYY